MAPNMCFRCKKWFSQKSAYDRHLNRKNKCKIINGIQYSPIDNTTIIVTGAQNDDDSFDDIDDIDDIDLKDQKMVAQLIKGLRKELSQLKNKVDNLKEGNIKNNINNSNNSNNNINSNNVNNTNIVVVNYGQEDMAKVDKKKIIECITRGAYNSAYRLTDLIHFDPEHPENQNIYISNMKNKYAMEYKNGSWNMVTKKELVDKIYRNKKEYIEENIEEFYKSLTSKQRESLDAWLNSDDDDDKNKSIKDDILLLLYNKRRMIMDRAS